MNSGDEVETQAETAAAVAVALGEDAATLERADDIVDQNAFLRPERWWTLALVQGMERGILGRHRRVGVFLLRDLIALVSVPKHIELYGSVVVQ
jgi:hypothetical protein